MRFRLLSVLIVVFAALIIQPTAQAIALPTTNSTVLESLPLEGRGINGATPQELIVKLKPPYSLNAVRSASSLAHVQSIGRISNLGIQRLRLSGDVDMNKVLEKYRKLPCVEYAEPNYTRRALSIPNDPYYNLQWALMRVHAPEFWDQNPANQVIVAVIDTGIDYTHPDLADNIIKGYDFINDDSDPMDDYGHGTHVAGIIAAKTNNKIGIAGVAMATKLLAIKALSAQGEGTDFQISNAIRYAVDEGAKVVSLSLGGPGWSTILKDAIDYARSKGCLVVASAGNDATDEPYYPAGYSGVISVSAVDSSDRIAYFSNYGPSVDVAAPGVDILSTYNDGEPCYVYASGTSMAAPVVSGIAALIASKYPKYTVDQLYRTILTATDDIGDAGRDDCFGFGLIDISKVTALQRTTIEESAKEVISTGSWESRSSEYASGGGFKTSSEADASCVYNFNGSSISWFAQTHIYSGIAKVYIDGVYECDVNLYGKSSDFQQPVFTKRGLTPGNHTIEIVVSGTKSSGSSGCEINIDCFDVESDGTASPLKPGEIEPPKDVKASVANHAIVISWDSSNSTSVTGYNVYRSTGATGTYSKINRATVKTNRFTNLSFKTDVTYYYKVTAVDKTGSESTASSAVSTKSSKRAKTFRR